MEKLLSMAIGYYILYPGNVFMFFFISIVGIVFLGVLSLFLKFFFKHLSKIESFIDKHRSIYKLLLYPFSLILILVNPFTIIFVPLVSYIADSLIDYLTFGITDYQNIPFYFSYNFYIIRISIFLAYSLWFYSIASQYASRYNLSKIKSLVLYSFSNLAYLPVLPAHILIIYYQITPWLFGTSYKINFYVLFESSVLEIMVHFSIVYIIGFFWKKFYWKKPDNIEKFKKLL